VLCFAGYPFITTLLLPAISDIEGISQTVTIPYRAFALFVSILVIIYNYKSSIATLPIALKALLFFWGILIIRLFYDINIRVDVQLSHASTLWISVFGICMPAIISIIKSYRYINLDKAFKWILILLVIALVISLFSNQAMLMSSDKIDVRQNANIALNSISYGQLSTSIILLAFYGLSKKRQNLFVKVLLIFIILLSFLSLLRAGSRGPLLALVVTIYFFLFARAKNIVWGLTIMTILIALTVVFAEPILNFMGSYSPVMEGRLKHTIYEGDYSGRDPLFKQAITAFLDSPIWGKQFALFRSNGRFIYSHNIILDAFMGLGILGGGTMIYFLSVALKKSYNMIRINDAHFWLGLILVQLFVSSMISSCFYYDQLLSALLTFLFLKYKQNKIPFRKLKDYQNQIERGKSIIRVVTPNQFKS
jgi:O-antigen ligase